MPHAVSAAYRHLLNETRVPLWNFAGIALVAVLIAYGSYASGETAKREEAYLNDPKPGDLYEVKIDGNYTSFRIEAVYDDSLLVSWNNYAVNKVTGLNDIEKDENYAEPVSLGRTEVADLERENSIHHIYRRGSR